MHQDPGFDIAKFGGVKYKVMFNPVDHHKSLHCMALIYYFPVAGKVAAG